MKTALKIIKVAFIIMISAYASFSQPQYFIYRDNGTKTALEKIGPVKIITKENGSGKNCISSQINPSYLVYEKDGSLHDLPIEKILRIEISKEEAIYFDEENKPKIKTTLPE